MSLLIFLALGLQEHELVTKLRSDAIAEREEAERSLLALGAAARPHLEKAAKDADRELVARAQYLLRRLDLRALLSPRLQKAVPGIDEKLARGDESAWTQVFLEAEGLKKGRREFPTLKREDLEPLAAAAVRGAATSEQWRLMSQAVVRNEFHSVVPELLRLLNRPEAVEPALTALAELGSAEAAPFIAQLLRSSEAKVRSIAAMALAATGGKESIQDLIPLFRDPDSGVRFFAAFWLLPYGSAELVPSYLPLLRDPSSQVRETALVMVERHDANRSSMEEVVRLLRDPNSGVRGFAASALGRLGASDQSDAIAALLEDKYSQTAGLAADALIELKATGQWPALAEYFDRTKGEVQAAHWQKGRTTWIPALEAALADPEPRLRKVAAWVLCSIQAKEALPALIRLLEEGPVEIRRTIAGEIHRFENPAAVPALVRRTSDEDAEVRGQALRALSWLEAEKAGSVAVRLLSDPSSNVRLTAINSLLHRPVPPADVVKLLEDPEETVQQRALNLVNTHRLSDAIPLLRSRLSSPSEWWRGNGVWTLGHLDDRASIPEFVRLFRDPAISVRKAAAQAVGRLGTREQIPALRKLLTDEGAGVRLEAMEALTRLGDREAIPSMLRILKEDGWDDVRLKAAECLCRFGRKEGVPTILAQSYELWTLNVLRFPELWLRLDTQKLKSDGEGTARELLDRIGREIGLPIRLPAGLETGPRVALNNRRGELTLREVFPRLFGRSVDSYALILEADSVRLVHPEEEYDFWAEWWEKNKP